MTIGDFLRKSRPTALTLAGVIAALSFGPWASRSWDEHLVRTAVAACERNAGVPLVGRDAVVSCAPRALLLGERKKP